MSDTPQDLELRILERAYFLWIEAGRPEGRAEEYYLRACELEVAEGRTVKDRTLDRFVTAERETRGFTNGRGE
jgi:hypothetical protein